MLVEQDLAAVVDRDHAQSSASLGCALLPRHDVGVMPEVGDQDLVVRAHTGPAPALGNQVDGLDRATDQTVEAREGHDRGVRRTRHAWSSWRSALCTPQRAAGSRSHAARRSLRRVASMVSR